MMKRRKRKVDTSTTMAAVTERDTHTRVTTMRVTTTATARRNPMLISMTWTQRLNRNQQRIERGEGENR